MEHTSASSPVQTIYVNVVVRGFFPMPGELLAVKNRWSVLKITPRNGSGEVGHNRAYLLLSLVHPEICSS